MKTRLILAVLLLICLLAPSAEARRHTFSTWSIEKGLSQSVVNCVFQDSRGFIWAGTQNGLNRFDGYTFKLYLYDPGDTSSISNNWIYSVCEDHRGDLWVATKGGLNQWVRKENRFRRIRYSTDYRNNLTSFPYDVAVARDGSVIINTPPVLSLYNPVTNSFRHYTSILAYDGAVKDNRMPLLEDRQGRIWTASTGGLACLDRRTGRFTYFHPVPGKTASLSNDNITALYEDAGGILWIGTAAGLNRLDPSDGSIQRLDHNPADPLSVGSNFIRAITGDSTGNLWIATEGGGLSRCRWSVPAGRLHCERYSSEQDGLASNIVLDLMIDRSHNLWAATLQGLSKTDLKPPRFRLYRRDDTPGSTDLSGNVIASIFKDENGLIWAGTWGQGLNLIDRRSGTVRHFSSRHTGSDHIPNDYIHVIFADLWNNIWIGTRDGIFVYDRLKGSFSPFRRFFRNPDLPDFRETRINIIRKARDNSYWIGTQNGLYRVTLQPAATEVFRTEAYGNHRLSGNLIYSVIEDRDGLIWIATLNGLDVYNPRNGKMIHHHKEDGPGSLSDNFVISLCEDHEGDIWIGTGSYVNRFHKKNGTFTYYGQEQGLPNNRIFEILEDSRRTLWFATGGGLSRFDSATGRFRTYTVEDGLQSMEFNLRACCASPDGEVFFGGMNGFNSFRPDSLSDNPFRPDIVFTSCYKTTGGEKEYIDVENTARIVLDHSDRNFTIEFAALEFTNPERNQYAYRLEGVSDDWILTGNRRFVPFASLAPGEYRFTVRGSNNDGVWNPEGRTLTIIVSPPWWRTPWAIAAWVIIISGLAMIFIRLRERQLLRERDLLEQKVHERTLQIEEQNTRIRQQNEELSSLNEKLSALNATRDKFFSIIAHDLRNPFNTILGLSEMAISSGNQAEAPGRMTKAMTDIRDTARHTFDLLQNLLLWARSQTGTLDFEPEPFDLAERIRENIDLVRSQADKKSISITFEEPGLLTANGDTRMIDTVLRNLLTNAIKFTPQGGSVTVTARSAGEAIEVGIADTGIGIATENLARLFQPDNRYVRKGTDKERGSGLGLMLCREFIEMHGGAIEAESTTGKGSLFRFTLPA